ncbi:MAG: hypothetical protein EP343_16760 [Deltaproteobacteria bacterium]|nr:MAG: hypothetical protein EP343_16760 [Deltaproteobacteria bacterium]
MFRIALWASLCAALWSLSFVACSGGGNTGDNSCEADRNCLSNERCYQGKCVLASEVPNNNSTGNSNTPDNNNSTANNNNPPANNNNGSTNSNDNTGNTNTNANNNSTGNVDYPEGPYGADVGDVAIPLALDNCDGSVVSKFKDYYKHPKIKVLLVSVHTGW